MRTPRVCRPINAETGEAMNDEEFAAFQEMLKTGMVVFDAVEGDLEECGVSKDEILSTLYQCAELTH